jgi:putative DNA primase/helicase
MIEQAPQPVTALNLTQHPDRDMRLRTQWICWKYEWLQEKLRKPPYHPGTGRKVDPTKKQVFGTYKEAVRTYLTGGYAGIGYVFYPEEHFIRLDFDDCRDPQSGQIDNWALEILAYLRTYAEISPSGDGLHAIARGKLNGRDRKVSHLGEHHRGTLEMYASGQNYFTWTNERYLEHAIIEASEQCNTLYDCAYWAQIYEERIREHLGGVAPVSLPYAVQREPLTPGEQRADTWLLNRARNAKNGSVFRELFDTLPMGNGSQHENDFRLCLMLLYWTQNEQSMPDLSWADRLFRQSVRFQSGRWEKWDRKLGAYTYGQVTLQKAYLQSYVRFGQRIPTGAQK